jgi:hypothetical protein
VQDATGASVPGADVVVDSIQENSDRTTTTDEAGEFSVQNVKPGGYRVSVHHDGFTDAQVSSAELSARQELRLPITLGVASQTTLVEVQAGAGQINTENAVLCDEKNNVQITQLPLNNRATTTSPLGGLTLSSNIQQDSQGNLSVGGASSSMVNFSVDGISTSNVRQNGALQDAYPSQEGISAVEVTAFKNSAEFSQVG